MDEATRQLQAIKEEYGVPDAGDDYDPYLHRDTEHPVSYFETVVHIVKGCVGTALLAMPLSFKQAGWLNAFVGSIFVCVISTYGKFILFSSRYQMSKDLKISYINYMVTTKVALLLGPYKFRRCSHFFGILIDVIMVVHQTGTSAAYLIFVAENIQNFVEHAGSSVNFSVRLYMLMLFPALIMIISIPDMKYMAKFSLLSNILAIISVVLTFVALFMTDWAPAIELRRGGEWLDTALALGIHFFAFSGMGVLICAEKDMKNPKQMTTMFGALNVSMFVVLFIHILIGYVGYRVLGENVKQSYTLNLFDINHSIGMAVQMMYVLSIYITYGLQGMVAVNILWFNYWQFSSIGQKYKSIGFYFTGFLIVIISTVCAAGIPLFAYIVSFLGAFGVTAMTLIFPTIIHVCVIWFNETRFSVYTVILDGLVLLFGILMCMIGSYSAVRKICIELKNRDPGF